MLKISLEEAGLRMMRRLRSGPVLPQHVGTIRPTPCVTAYRISPTHSAFATAWGKWVSQRPRRSCRRSCGLCWPSLWPSAGPGAERSDPYQTSSGSLNVPPPPLSRSPLGLLIGSASQSPSGGRATRCHRSHHRDMAAQGGGGVGRCQGE